MFERFTDAARRVLVLAQEEARQLGHDFIGTEHFLLALLQDGETIAGRALASFGIQLSTAREMVEATIGPTATGTGGFPPFTPRAKKALELSLRAALQLGSDDIGSEHILLGLIQIDGGVGAQILERLGASPAEVRQRVVQLLSETHAGLGDRLTDRPDLPPEPSGEAARPTTGAPQVIHQGRIVACSFCGRTPPATGQIVAGEGAFICEHCLLRWSRRLTSGGRFATGSVRLARSPGAGLTDVRRGVQPDDPAAARNEIEAAYEDSRQLGADGEGLPTVEKGANLGPALTEAQQRHRAVAGQHPAMIVEEIAFVDAEHAAVLFSIYAGGRMLLARHRGDAVVEGGVWKMARPTFCELMTMAGVDCPPEPEP